MSKFCDNISSMHSPITIAEDANAMRVICTECKGQYVIRKDHRGVVENRQYSKIFKRDIVQKHENLFFKRHSKYLNT